MIISKRKTNRLRLWISLVGFIVFTSSANAGIVIGSAISSRDLLNIDETTGAGTSVGTLNRNVTGLAFDPVNNILYGVDDGNDELVTISLSTGAATVVGALGPVGSSFTVDSLAFDQNTNTLYATDVAADVLLGINPATGTASQIGTNGDLGSAVVSGLAFNPNGPGGGVLYGVDRNSDQLLTIDTSTGVGSTVGTFASSSDFDGLAYDTQTNTLFGADNLNNPGKLFRIDTSTAGTVEVGDINFGSVEGLTAVPEPFGFGFPCVCVLVAFLGETPPIFLHAAMTTNQGELALSISR